MRNRPPDPPQFEGKLAQPCAAGEGMGCPSIGWEAAAENISATVRPYIKAGIVKGLFYGDELSGAVGVSFDDYDRVTRRFRDLLGEDLIYLTNDAWSAVTEGRVGAAGGNDTLIPCKFGKLPPAGLCPGYWPKVPPALTHISLDSCEYRRALPSTALSFIRSTSGCETFLNSCTTFPDIHQVSQTTCDNFAADTGDCFWEALSTRGLYEQYLYPRMAPEQKVFLVPGIGPGDACDPRNASCGETCTGFWNSDVKKAEAQMQDAILVLLKNYMMWTQQDSRVEGWLPWHYQSGPPGYGSGVLGHSESGDYYGAASNPRQGSGVPAGGWRGDQDEAELGRRRRRQCCGSRPRRSGDSLLARR